MEERENKVKEIIKSYEEGEKGINKKYEAKSLKKYDNKETKQEIEKIEQELRPIDSEIEILKRGLQNVKEEEPNNKKLILQYEEQIKGLEQDEKRQNLLKHKQEILEKSSLEENKIEEENKAIALENKKNNSKNRDIKQRELRELEDKVRKELTRESIAIENDLKRLELDMQVTLSEMHNFKYEYEEGKRICTNGEEYKKLGEKYNKQQDLKEDLNRAKSLCNSKLKEFKDKDDKRVEKINEILKNRNANVQQNQGQQSQSNQTTQTTQSTQATQAAQTQFQNIYSSSKDKVTSIYINAFDGKAYIGTLQEKSKEINIKDAIKEKRKLFKNLDINATIEKVGVDSRIKQFMIRRKINPVILKAIQEDRELTNQYIESVINNEEFPFEYTHNLENSSLSNKDTNFMNRLALKESKIKGNVVKGAEKLRAIKNIYRKIKDKAQKSFQTKEELKQLGEGKKEKLSNKLNKQMEEQNRKYDEAYNDLTDEQKSNLKNMKVSDLQKLGMEYTTACGVIDKYGKSEKIEEQEENTVNNKKEDELML